MAPDERTLPGGFGLGLNVDAEGLFVDAVSDASPAALAGLREGDRVRRWNGAAPTTVADAWAAVHGTDTMTLVVERHGRAIARVLRRTQYLPPLP
jgi:S1-C subfamily serine protease